MIKNQWYAVLNSKQLKKGKLLGVTRLGEKLVFWRDRTGKVGCAFDRCAHRGAALSAGKIVSNNALQCPFHGFEYDTEGKVTKIPANGENTPVPQNFKVNAYHAVDQNGFIWIFWGKQRKTYPPIPFFEDIDKKFRYDTFIDHWPVHYSRAIENQLDVVHLPFVHSDTIGRGCKTLIDGPIIKWTDKELQVWVFMRTDDGTKPKKPQELTEPNYEALLHFRFGNIWQNRLGEGFRIVAAFAPIDEENTMIYLRLYQKIWRLPVSGWLITKLANRIGNKKILRQDKRVVITQIPKKTTLKMDENLVQGDLPIVEYRRKREALIEENNK